MKEDRIGTCTKCGIKFYVHAHHIFPQAFFGKKGETHDLCPNCHTHYHNYSKKHIQNPEDKNEIADIWQHWLSKVTIVIASLLILFAVKYLI